MFQVATTGLTIQTQNECHIAAPSNHTARGGGKKIDVNKKKKSKQAKRKQKTRLRETEQTEID